MLLVRLIVGIVALALLGGAAFWALTMPRGLSGAELAALPEGDAGRGQTMFWIGGCDSCHAPARAQGDDRFLLGGGQKLATDFGTFVVPNISPHPQDGIGAWSAGDFANAMLHGISPDGRHLYPAFPYASYARMETGDVADLWAYLKTLPEVAGVQPGHQLAFPYSLRRGVGLWKLAFLDPAPVVAVDAADPVLLRGRYLAEGPGHCGECHTPRNFAGALDDARWLGGAPNPDGEGRIPNITGGVGGLEGWSAGDLVYYFETGFTPEFDSVGGSMAAVQRNLAELGAGDRDAIASYVKAVPPVDRAP